MHAALLFRLRHALDPVHSALVLHLAVDLLAIDERDDFLQSADRGFAHRSHLDPPSQRLGVPIVHPEDFRGEQRGFIAAGSGPDFEHDVLLIVGILGQKQYFQLVLDALFDRLETGDLVDRHLFQVGIGVGQHGASLFEVAFHAIVPCFTERQAGHAGKNVDPMWWHAELRHNIGSSEVNLANLHGATDMPIAAFEYQAVLEHVLAGHTSVRSACNAVQKAQIDTAS